jgi:hypothetical protein
LNDNATDFKIAEVLKTITWLELIKAYGKTQVKAFAINLGRNLRDVLPSAIQPIFLIFLPLSLGMLRFWKRQKINLAYECLLILYALPFIFIIPALQLQERYIYPINIVVIPFVGIGVVYLWETHLLSNSCKYLCRLFTVLLMIALLLYAMGVAYRTSQRNYYNAIKYNNYQKASEWIVANSTQYDYIMSRYHGIYAYVKRKKLSLPIDSLEKMAKYIQYTGTRYLVIGPYERFHNNEVLRFPAEKGKYIYVGEVRFDTVQTYGKNNKDMVMVVEARY